MIVEEPHGVVGRKTDMPRCFVELFERPIEGRAHAGTMSQVDCLSFCVGGIIFGQVSMFVVCGGDTFIEEQVVTFTQPSKRPSDVLLPCYFALLVVFFWVKHDSSVVCFV